MIVCLNIWRRKATKLINYLNLNGGNKGILILANEIYVEQMNYPVIIVDDEHDGAESLEILIKNYCPKLEVKAIVHNVQNAVSAILLHKPVIVFLDIQMPSGSGFEVIEQTKEMNYSVIFTTAHEEFALKAIKANAIDYLLKPIIAEELIRAVDKGISIKPSNQISGLLAMLEQLNNAKPADSKITISNNQGLLFIEPEEIIRLEADSNYTHFYLSDGKKITASKTLKEIEKLLPGYFIKVHSSYIINRKRMVKYIKGDGGYLVMDDNVTVPVSRSYKADFLGELGKA